MKLTQSTDGGASWTTPAVVNDNVDAPGAPTDQFQRSIAAGPTARSPSRSTTDAGPAPMTRACWRPTSVATISASTPQAYNDSGSGPCRSVRTFVSRNSRGIPSSRRPVATPLCRIHGSRRSWQRVPRQLLRLAISKGNIYALTVSTHYPSTVTVDEGGPIYYQQQVLATVPRIGFGVGSPVAGGSRESPQEGMT